MRTKTINLKDKKLSQAKRTMKKLIAWRNQKNIQVKFNFLLPQYTPSRKNYFWPEKLSSRCPYCGSPLVTTDVGVVCSGKNLPSIIWDIRKTIEKWGDKAELFLSGRRANRFFDDFVYAGNDMTCNYVQGNEEYKYRIRNRILRPGVDRRKIRQ